MYSTLFFFNAVFSEEAGALLSHLALRGAKTISDRGPCIGPGVHWLEASESLMSCSRWF